MDFIIYFCILHHISIGMMGITTARSINIAMFVKPNMDVDNQALYNSKEWAQVHILNNKGVMLNIFKIVIYSDDIFRDEILFSRNISQASYILEPYFVHPHLCFLSNLLNIPLISVYDTPSTTCRNVVRLSAVNPFHTHEVMTQLLIEQDVPVVELIVEQGLSDIAIEMVTNNDGQVYYSILNVLTNISDSNEIADITNELQTSFHKNILLLTRSPYAATFIEKIKTISKNDELVANIQWFIPSLPPFICCENRMFSQQIKGSILYGLNIPTDKERLQQVTKEIDNMKTDADREFPGYLNIDPFLHDAIETIARTVATQPFRYNHYHRDGGQCPVRKRNFKTKITSKIQNMKFQGLTGKIEFTRNGYRNFSNLAAVHVDRSGRLHRIGQWSEECEVFKLDKTIRNKKSRYKKKRRCKNTILSSSTTAKIRKRHLKIVVMVDEPFIFYNETYGQGNNRFRGFCKDLMDRLSKELGFSYDLYLVPDKNPTYGTCEIEEEDAPCKWTGMMGEIVRKKADIGTGSITITSEREQYVDFSKPFMDFTMTLIMQKPDGQQFDIYAFLKPFDYSVWLAIMAVSFGVTVILFAIDYFSPKGCRKLSKKQSSDKNGDEFTFYNCVWFTCASLLQQGPDYTPKSSAARVLSATFWFFTLIIISSYTANLAAFFTTNQQHTGIKSLEDLAKQDKLQYGILGRGQTYSLFKNSDIPLYKQMFNSMRSYKSFARSSKEGVARVREGGYAYLSEDPLIYYQHQRQPCNTAVLRNLLEAKSYGLVLQQQSEWTNPISVKILDLREQGFIEKLRNRWWDETSECTVGVEQTKGQPISLNLSSLAGIYIIMIAGAMLACVLLFVETKYKGIVSKGRCLLGGQYTFNKKNMKNQMTFIDHCETEPVDPVLQKLQNQMNGSHDYLTEKTVKRSFYSPGQSPTTFATYNIPEPYKDMPESTL